MALRSLFNQHGSVISQYLWQRFPHTAGLARAANLQLGAAFTVRPDAASYPWAVVARATALRIRYSLGYMAPRTLLAWRGAQFLAQAPAAPYPLAALAAIFADLAAVIARVDPVGRTLAPTEEATLCRACYMLGLCDDLARTGRLEYSPLLEPTVPRTAAGWLALAAPTVVADLAGMATRFTTQHDALLTQPRTLFPAFDAAPQPGAALDPLILGDTLALVKVTTQPTVEARWMRELVGYALCDVADRFGIQQVGIIAPRQGMVLRWPLADVVARLAGEPHATLAHLRHEFAAIRRAARGLPLPAAG
jgi:hypothetical protein